MKKIHKYHLPHAGLKEEIIRERLAMPFEFEAEILTFSKSVGDAEWTGGDSWRVIKVPKNIPLGKYWVKLSVEENEDLRLAAELAAELVAALSKEMDELKSANNRSKE